MPVRWPLCVSAGSTEAAGWALKASARPNAHPHIQAIAAYSLPLAEWLDETRAHLGVVHASRPRYGIDVFYRDVVFRGG